MRRKLTIGVILFVGGMILQEVSYMADIWIIRVLGGILWPVGMAMGINASMYPKPKKQCNNSSHQSKDDNS